MGVPGLRARTREMLALPSPVCKNGVEKQRSIVIHASVCCVILATSRGTYERDLSEPDSVDKRGGLGHNEGDNMIVINQLTKRFGTQVAVDSLSFEMAAGQIVGLLGPNGAR